MKRPFVSVSDGGVAKRKTNRARREFSAKVGKYSALGQQGGPYRDWAETTAYGREDFGGISLEWAQIDANHNSDLSDHRTICTGREC